MTVVLTREEFKALERLATVEERIASQQATILIRRALQEAPPQHALVGAGDGR